ncbi:hypothetical protein Bca4012_021357 [Brassica carinata]
MDLLEQKRQKRVQIGDFHAEQSDDCSRSSGTPECLFQRQRFLRKIQYLGICRNYLIFFSQPPVVFI